nr:hypothetical protein TDPV-012 [Oriental turtle dovepox virus]
MATVAVILFTARTLYMIVNKNGLGITRYVLKYFREVGYLYLFIPSNKPPCFKNWCTTELSNMKNRF